MIKEENEPKWVTDYNKSSFNSIVDFAEEQLKAIKRKELIKKIVNEMKEKEADKYVWVCTLKEYLELKQLIK